MKVFRCKNCLNISTRPRISFDKRGWCNACQWTEEKKTIDPALIAQDWLSIKHTMWNYVGLSRNEKRLQQAFDMLKLLEFKINNCYIIEIPVLEKLISQI